MPLGLATYLGPSFMVIKLSLEGKIGPLGSFLPVTRENKVL